MDWMAGAQLQQPNNVNADYGLSNFSRKNNFRASGIYTVPFKHEGFVGGVINGWQVTAVYTYLSGAPSLVPAKMPAGRMLLPDATSIPIKICPRYSGSILAALHCSQRELLAMRDAIL